MVKNKPGDGSFSTKKNAGVANAFQLANSVIKEL